MEFGRENVMNKTKTRIKAMSTAIVCVLVFIAALSAISSIWAVWGWAANGLALDIRINAGVWIMRQILLTVLLVYAAFIFHRIGKEETPFFKKLPRRIKIAAVLLFVALVVPQWIGYAALSISTGTFSFVVFDENSIMALALAFVVFCLGQIFEYGYLVQDENYEII